MEPMMFQKRNSNAETYRILFCMILPNLIYDHIVNNGRQAKLKRIFCMNHMMMQGISLIQI